MTALPRASLLSALRLAAMRAVRNASPTGSGTAAQALPPELPVSDALFVADTCSNCGAVLAAPFCGHCGQKKVGRLRLGQLRIEAWESYRLFDMGLVRSALRLAARPGAVAREYVLGARKQHVHPLKLLLVAIGLLLLVQNQIAYLDSSNTSLGQAMALVKDYAKWSFSIGIIAILATSLLLFRRRLGYNATEHLVLATYTHFLIIAANVINLSVLLVVPHAWVPLHKQASLIYMGMIESGLVALAFAQFFALDWRRDWPRVLLAAALFLAIKQALLYAYGRAVLKIVLAQLT